MVDIDFSAMADDELLDVREKVDAAYKVRFQKMRNDAKKRIAELAAKYDIDLSAMSAKAEKSSPAIEAKFRDPENQFNTWSGKGRKPKWLAEAVKSGKDISEYQS